MDLNDKDIKKLSVLLLVLILAVFVFLLVKPIILSIIGGLILAYAFFPIYKFVLKRVKSKNLAASIVSIIAILLIAIPTYFLAPFLFKQMFEIFESAQVFDMQSFIRIFFPSAPDSFIVQMTLTIKNAISEISSTILNALVNILIKVPKYLFNLIIVAFVFFFTLRDSEKLSEFVSTLSPLNKVQEKKLVKQFKNITNSIVYGQVVIGIAQGIIAGIGFFLFGIPGALILTVLAITLSIIPIVGPILVWIPAAIYLFSQGNTFVAVLFVIYNFILVSNMDNFLRVYLVSKNTNLSQVIVLIGMIGGLLIFGVLGLILGPLLLAYFITFLDVYRKENLSSLFKHEN
jgi:predicted PurR-regulated permease PerM